MSKKPQAKPTVSVKSKPRPEKQSELSQTELDKVTGGKVTVPDIKL